MTLAAHPQSPPVGRYDYLAPFRDFRHAKGLTHNLYRYPARSSPDFIRHLILQHSEPDDLVLDPFMGGGTTIVEAVSQGRRAVGVDLNPISRLVTGAKTVSLSSNERGRIAEWARQLSSAIGAENSHIDCKTEERLRNLPESVQSWFRYARASTGALRTSKERRLARCILLQWGQGLLERASFQDGRQAGERLKRVANECLLAVDAFTQQATKVGLSRRALTGRRALYCSSAETFPFADNPGTVKLVVTSPPYPGVHVVYHRWQILGRKETPKPQGRPRDQPAGVLR